MKKMFETDEIARKLFKNLRDTLLKTRPRFDLLIERCKTEEEKKEVYELQDLVESVNASFKKLNQLIDIINFPPNKWDKIPIELPIQQAIEKLMKYADRKNISIKMQTKNFSDKGIIYGDIDLLSQFVFENLISNAIKYSQRDSEISIIIEQRKSYYDVIIQDQGVGIPHELLKDFGTFGERIYKQGTEGENGSGMSIPLVRRVMKKLNGSVTFHSITDMDNPQHGTTIKLSFHKWG